MSMTAIESRAMALKLTDWLKAEGIDFEDAPPVLAMVMGVILGRQCSHVPRDKLDEHLNEGIAIVSAMINVSASFEAELERERRTPQ